MDPLGAANAGRRTGATSYRLGVDLGTTYTAAAVARGGAYAMTSLGAARVDIPSTVCVEVGGDLAVGESAEVLALDRPTAVAREFKRRLGDHVPLIIDGHPFSPQTLMAQVLRWTVAQVAQQEGGQPELLAVTCPANWGPYKHELLRQVVRMADVPSTIIATEPEAAAILHAGVDAQREGSLVGVYDLGGGTFDAAILKATRTGAFTLAGPPEGIEHLGGIDLDEAIYSFVLTALGREALDLASSDDPAVVAAMATMRRRCVAAKERLSSEQVASIPVALPGLVTEVRITRPEFESMVRPALEVTVQAVIRALRNADTTADRLTSLILVGGSVRIPLIFESVSRALDCQVVMPRNPSHSVALGAAMAAGRYRIPRPTAGSTKPVAAPVRRASIPPREPEPVPRSARDATVLTRELVRIRPAERAALASWLVEPGVDVTMGQGIATLDLTPTGAGPTHETPRTAVLRSPYAGVLQRTFVAPGGSIEADDLLVAFQQVAGYLVRPNRGTPSDRGIRIRINPPRSATAVTGRPVIFLDRVPYGLWWAAEFCLLAEPGEHAVSAAYSRGNQWFGFVSQVVRVPEAGLLGLVYSDPGLGTTALLEPMAPSAPGHGRAVGARSGSAG